MAQFVCSKSSDQHSFGKIHFMAQDTVFETKLSYKCQVRDFFLRAQKRKLIKIHIK